jgi:hypothetical protein
VTALAFGAFVLVIGVVAFALWQRRPLKFYLKLLWLAVSFEAGDCPKVHIVKANRDGN